MRTCLLAAFVAAIVSFGSFAHAALVTSITGGTVVPMPTVNYFGSGPQVFGPNITWTSTNSTIQGGSVFGYDSSYGFGSNGSWSSLTMAGVNSTFSFYGVTDTMTFEFDTPVAGVGGFINYYPDGRDLPTIAIYDSSNTLLDTAVLTFLTGGGTNTGEFWGFQIATPDIKYFRLSDAYIGITDLTITGLDTPGSVPEPATLTIFALGAIGMVAGARRARRA